MANRREFLGLFAAVVGSASFPAAATLHEGRLKRTIPGTDESLPIIGLGNSPSFREQDLGVARELIGIFLQHGGGYIDARGISRIHVGRVAREKHASDELFIGNYVDPQRLDAMRTEVKSIAESQGKTALDLIHTRSLDGYRRQIDDYRQLKEEGLVRYIGIARSGRQTFDDIMKLIDDGLVDFVQVNYSLVEPEAADRLLPLAEQNGVAVVINRPFINGRYFDIVSGRDLPGWAADFDCDSWAQFALKFIAAHTAVVCVLTETTNPKHAMDNLGAGSGRLPDEQTRRRMLELLQGWL